MLKGTAVTVIIQLKQKGENSFRQKKKKKKILSPITPPIRRACFSEKAVSLEPILRIVLFPRPFPILPLKTGKEKKKKKKPLLC